jgi:hypothetical protein
MLTDAKSNVCRLNADKDSSVLSQQKIHFVSDSRTIARKYEVTLRFCLLVHCFTRLLVPKSIQSAAFFLVCSVHRSSHSLLPLPLTVQDLSFPDTHLVSRVSTLRSRIAKTQAGALILQRSVARHYNAAMSPNKRWDGASCILF